MSVWYTRSFGKDYLLVYKHRNLEKAYEEVKNMSEWLMLPQGAEILDLCCGMGRHALALSDFGYQVTGIDLSTELLNEAKKLDVSGKVKWIHGDMRRVPLDQTFDAVVNLFTSFGYFEADEENAQVLTEIDRVLKVGGKFIIDFLNPSYVEKHLIPYSERNTDGVNIKERRYIADGFVKKEITITDGQSVREYIEQVKLYRLPDFEQMMSKTNLNIQHVYGSYDQSVYDENESPRMILVGMKEEVQPS